MIEQQRVLDAVAHEGVDFEPLVVGDQNFLALVVEGEDALVDIDHVVDDRQLGVQAGGFDEIADGLSEAQHQRLFGRIDGEEHRRRQPDERDEDDGDEDERGLSHLTAPAVFACGSSAM